MSSKSPKQPPDKKVQVTKHTRGRKINFNVEKKCSRCKTKKKLLSGFFLHDWYKDESERVCKDCRPAKQKRIERIESKLATSVGGMQLRECRCLINIKVCNMCNTWKKRHGFKKEQWDRNDESDRICNRCFNIVGVPEYLQILGSSG